MAASSLNLASALFDIGCVKFGQFKLKSGLISPIYIDLRLLVSHPVVLHRVAQAMAGLIGGQTDDGRPKTDDGRRTTDHSSLVIRRPSSVICQSAIVFDRLAAIPYAGLPIGVAVALEMGRPLIYPRKDAKEYGTAKLIEGEYKSGETALLVDDLITKGTSKFEALEPLLGAGLVVKDVLVLIDRQQGGAAQLAARGVTLHAVLTLSSMLDELVEAGRLSAAQRDDVLAWVKAN